MNDQLAERMLQQLERMTLALESLARAGAPAEPDYVKPLSDYRAFDWESIGASVVHQDADGPTHVEWGGALWTRRSPSNKFEPAIWYSRSSGKDDEGNNKYLRLITFRPVKDAAPVPDKTVVAAKASAPSIEIPAHAPAGKTNGQATRSNGQAGQVVFGAGPQQPARKPTGPLNPTKAPAAGQGALSWADYFKKTTRELALRPKAADRIAALDGLGEKSPDLGKALVKAEYFAHAKRLGLTWEDALAILQQTIMDVEKATKILVAQHTPPEPKEPDVPF